MNQQNPDNRIEPVKDTLTDKRVLREQYVAARRGLHPEYRQLANEQVCCNMADLLLKSGFLVMDKPVVGLYRAFRGEVDVMPLAKALRNHGIATAFPVTNPDRRTMAFYRVGEDTVWHTGSYGIEEPNPSSARHVSAEDIQVLIVPGVAFARNGLRLGYGGGFYDRFFSRHPRAIRIAAAFACQVADALPAEPHDVRMHYIATEAEVFPCEPVR